jgi:hypothetical protein
MNVFLTFDIEVWCDGWRDLDQKFAGSFMRYVYGKSVHGDYALPKTLEILGRNGLAGVFFVEPLFATRFGAVHLETIVQLIQQAGQQVQLHLHPEWTDEALQPIIKNCATKRQHLCHYTLAEQTQLIQHGKQMLLAAGSGPVTVFRAGSYAANRDTFSALARNEIFLDASLNHSSDVSALELRATHDMRAPFVVDGVTTLPLTVFKDGFGKERPAQVGACSFAEMCDALQSAYRADVPNFVIISHNFEMLKLNSSKPDWVVVQRFERLCAYLAQHTDQFTVRGFDQDLQVLAQGADKVAMPQAGMFATGWRYAEQLLRRVS